MRLTARHVLLIVVALLLIIQFIPVPKTNPPSNPTDAFRASRPAGDPAVAILDRSCRDCHSNATVWPWYSRIAPVSWLLYRDVHGGRRELNLSEFNTYNAQRKTRKLEQICDEVKSGDMPPWFYLPMHPDAKLRPGDVDTLCRLSAQSGSPAGSTE